jgi:hypothetical protein
MKPNLHDALFHSYRLECSQSATVVIEVSFRADENSRDRSPATIRITNVDAMACNVDLARQAIHAKYGNVSDWSPSKGRGTTFIHLAGGTISVFGDEPEFSGDAGSS